MPEDAWEVLVTPEQFNDIIKGGSIDTGEKRLIFAMFMDALGCLEKYHHSIFPSEQRLMSEALDWVDSEFDWPYSFENVCAYLQLDHEVVEPLVLAAILAVGEGAHG